jgi:hypothetical protein
VIPGSVFPDRSRNAYDYDFRQRPTRATRSRQNQDTQLGAQNHTSKDTGHSQGPIRSFFMKTALFITSVSLSLAAAGAFAATPDGKGGGTAHVVRGDSPDANILFHGGPVMTGKKGVVAYIIWYGNWSGNSGKTLVPAFLNGLGASPYWAINTNYYDSANKFIKPKVKIGGQVDDNYSLGSNLSDASIRTLVSNHITNGDFPANKNGIYLVLTSKDVNETSGFCTVYCGWHTHTTISSKDIKYSFVGDAARCINACAAQSTSPNNNPGVDGMMSVIAHELEEAATDPDLNAWYFSTGAENADQCAWTFGTTYQAANGSDANMNIGGKDWLIQQNWVRGGTEHCALHP